MSTAAACVFGAAPNAVEAPEKIFERVFNWACTSSPMTVSQPAFTRSPVHLNTGGHLQMPIGIQLVLVRNVQHLRLAEVVADDLQPDRESFGIEAAGDRHAGKPRQVDRD